MTSLKSATTRGKASSFRRVLAHAMAFFLLVAAPLARADWAGDVDEIRSLLLSGDPAGAERRASASLAAGPSGLFSGTGKLIIHHWRGRTRLVLGDTAGAIADADTIIGEDSSLFPPDAGYALRGVARAVSGDKAGAEAEFDTLTKRGPSGMNRNAQIAALHGERAIARILVGDLDGADADLAAAIAPDYGFFDGPHMPLMIMAWKDMRGALARMKAGAPGDALADFRRITTLLSSGKGGVISDFTLSQLIVNKLARQETRAVEVREDERLLQAQQHLAAGNRGEAFRLYAQAFADAATAATQDKALSGLSLLLPAQKPAPGLPEEARRFLVQSRTYLQDRNYAKAIELYDRAMKIAPWWASIHFDKAMLLEQVGRYAQATASMRRYLLLAPGGEQAREAQDKIYEWEPRIEQEKAAASLGPRARGVSATAAGSDCFIATAAYGSALDPHVAVLRRFRDEHLLGNAPGRWLVATYYEWSPPIADFIRERETLRAAVRWALAPVVLAVARPGLALAVLLALCVAAFAWRRRRARNHA